jgi:hypothetical protein
VYRLFAGQTLPRHNGIVAVVSEQDSRRAGSRKTNSSLTHLRKLLSAMDDIDVLLVAGEPSASQTHCRNICKICCGEWHGLPANDGCPGAYATPEQERAYWQIVDGARNGRRVKH